MEIRKEQICISQKGKKVHSQAVMEQDFNVPDNKPDMGRIVTSHGKIQIEEIVASEDYVRIKGRLEFRVLYVTDSGIPSLASMEGQIPVDELVYVEHGENENYQVRVGQVHIMANLIHSRKMGLRVIAEFLLHQEKYVTEEIAVSVESTEQIFQKKTQVDALQLYENKREICRFKSEVHLTGTKENIGELVWYEAELRKVDSKIAADSVAINGEIQLFCIYHSEDGKTDWIEQNVPFETQIACQGAGAGCYHFLICEQEEHRLDGRLDEDGELRVLGLESMLEFRVIVYKEETVQVLEDVYSVSKNCQTAMEKICLEEAVMQSHLRHKVIEKIQIPEIRDEILQICHCDAQVQIEELAATEDGINVEGILHLHFLYVKANDQIPFAVWSGLLPFSYLVECEGSVKEMRYDITCGLEQLSVELAGNAEVEVKACLGVQSFLRKTRTMEMVSEVEMQEYDRNERDKMPGIVGYLAKEGDDIWKLAKKYGTTEEKILEINGLTTKILKEGDRILILKENMSIL